jgi:integrase
MAVLAECPKCHKKQSVKAKLCLCGEDLDKAKRSKKVRFWINYRLPGGKQKREAVGFSIEEARDAEGKRRSQKRGNRIFDIRPDSKMTFDELTKWYIGLETVKSRAYFETLKINLNSFNKKFGSIIITNLKPVDLQNYQVKRQDEGYSDSYIDQEIGAARTMINKAFDNDIVCGDVLRVFKKVKKLLKRNANARSMIITPGQFQKLMDELPRHARAIVATAFYTGMRRGEIVSLTWDKVDLKKRMITLEAKDTKDKKPRKVPICDELAYILSDTLRAIYDNHVFLYRGKPIKDIRTTLARACRKIGMEYGRQDKAGFVFHDLRHTFNTLMRKAGIDESVIMSITGHSTREMFDRYNTIDEEDTRNALTKFQGLLTSVDQNVDQVGLNQQKRGDS